MTRESIRLRVTAVVVFLFLLVSPISSQVLTSTIRGTVEDPTGAVVPGATVAAVDVATNREFRTVTDEAGNFVLANLPSGFYQLTVTATGFAKYLVPRVQANVAQTAMVHARLKLAAIGSEVVVMAEQSVIETEAVEQKNAVTREQIMNLPLPTRNPLDLVRTMPGIVTPTSSGIADAFVHGLRGNSTNITQDGINVADNFVKTSSFFSLSAPTVDTVGEFNVSIGGIGVDAGFGAAQVNIRTARGSNQLHGSAFWFQRTNFLNANTWFNNAGGTPRPFQLQNRIGANVGGPIYFPKVYNGKDRTWFFGAIEIFREPVAQSRTRTVMTQSARAGLFTYIPTCTAATCPVGVTPGVPRTVDLLTLGLPGATLNTAALAFYSQYVPQPNTDAGCGSGDGVNIRCYQFNLPGKGKQNRYTMRVDHQITRNHSIEFVYNQANFSTSPDFLNGIEPQFPTSPSGGQESKRQVFSWALLSTFGTKMTNELRAGLTRAPVVFNYPNQFTDTGGYQLSFPGVLTNPTFTTANLPQGRNTPVRQITDNFSWVKGRHTLRFGGEYRMILANSFFYNTVIPFVQLGTNSANSNGIVATDFLGGISSGDLTRAGTVYNAVTGMLSTVSQGFNHTSPTSGFVSGVPRTITPLQHNIAAYLQDNFKLRPNLTITAGVRWELQGVFDLRNKLILLAQAPLQGLWGPSKIGSLFSPSATPVTTDTLLDFAGGRNGSSIYNLDKNNFAPYAGFAWDPWSNGKTSIRGSFATHFTQDGFTLFQLASTGNTGLFSVVANNTPTGVFNSASVPGPPIPGDVFPVSQRANFTSNTGANLWVFDPKLATPYVLEWSLSLSREVWKRIAVEARYVGNHAVKQYRAYSINALNLYNSPFTFGGNSVANIFTEFQNAQLNLGLCTTTFSPACNAAARPLPIFSALFTGLSAANSYTNATFLTQLQQNQIGAMFDTLRRSNTYRPNRELPANNFPLNFFVANPFANNAIWVGSGGWSNYHGLELEVRRRFSAGLFFQANYTFSKVLTSDRFLTSQNEFQNYRALSNLGLDKNRSAFDITQSFSANFIYSLPIGKGKWLGKNANPWLNALIGGWQVQGLTRISSGGPLNITTPRLTTGSLVGTNAVIRNMTASEIQKHVGVFRRPEGVFWLDPNSGLFTINSVTKASSAVKCAAGQTTPCFDYPGAGQEGNLPFFGIDGPKFVNQDLSVIKKVPVPAVSEQFNFEIRVEFFNAFNHPNFGTPATDIDSSSFGKLTAIVDTVRGGGVNSRIIQWAVRINF